MRTRGIYYGWILVGVAFVFYGFGISPAYYSWGLLGRPMSEELGLDREQLGRVFGLFALAYSIMSAVSGAILGRWGIRTVVTGGLLTTALGFALLSRIESFSGALICFGLLVGCGVGISTIIPAQTLASNWFIRYRARAIAIVLTAGGVVGRLITPIDTWMLREADWRAAWLLLSGITLVVAVIAALMIRNRPEDHGLLPDGVNESSEAEMSRGPAAPSSPDRWTARQALRTPQFLLITSCAVAYAIPWGVVVPHGPTHLGDLGFSTTAAGAMIGTMALVSVLGRLVGGVGDFLPPQVVLAASLVVEGLGFLGLVFAEQKAMAYTSCIVIGLGFGTAYISIPVVLASYFGRIAFAATSGVRTMITGFFNFLGPTLAGWSADRTGSYTLAFVCLVALCAGGAVIALVTRAPGEAPTGLRGAVSSAERVH